VPVCELRSDLGIADIDPQNLIAMRRCDLTEHFERALGEFDPYGGLGEMNRIPERSVSERSP